MTATPAQPARNAVHAVDCIGCGTTNLIHPDGARNTTCTSCGLIVCRPTERQQHANK